MAKFGFIAFVILTGCIVGILGQSTTTTPAPKTTTPNIEEECRQHAEKCDECVKNAKCLWCESRDMKCIPYPGSEIIPHKDVCDLGDARWGVCWVNYKVLLIVMGCLAGVLLISFSCCIYCCCCRRKSNRAKYAQEEARIEREREERREKHSERRTERQSRMNEIRQKYGLAGKDSSDSRYKRFENEA